MTIKHLIEVLGRVAGPGVKVPGDHGALQELALALADVCAEFEARGAAAKCPPGTIDAVHAVRQGVDVTILAHLEFEQAAGHRLRAARDDVDR